MKNKIILKIITLLLCFGIMFSGYVNANTTLNKDKTVKEYNKNIDSVIQKGNNERAVGDKVTVREEYNQSTNQVTIYIISNIELKDTKPTWQLSQDRKTYTKVFSTNQTYSTPVENINGEIIDVQINVTKIVPTQVDVRYEYNENTNQVIAYITSNVELKNTKPTWQLSQDRKTYAKVFSANQTYSTPVEDKNGQIIDVKLEITQIKDFTITVEKKYDENTNKVTAKIISSVPLQHTKPTWELGQDRKTYTKVFSENQKYSTPVQDTNGNILMAELDIKEVKIAKITTDWAYDYNTNKVTAMIKSDTELQDTKPTWKLSEDKKIYTKVFTENISYSTPVVDKYGNIIEVKFNIDAIDLTSPEVLVEYKYTDDDKVIVSLKANEELGETKPNWTLSGDKMTYQHTFTTDQSYFTYVEDVHGNKTKVKIEFKMKKYTYTESDNSTIKVRYLYIDKVRAEVDIISSVKMKDTKPTWKLSEDGYKYTKVFTENSIYSTPIEDINGRVKNVSILVNLFPNHLTGIDVSKHQGKIDWVKVKNSGIDFAIIRCGYGKDDISQDDQMFKYNVSECERLGIPYGIYIYSYALNVEGALSEADHVLRLVRGHNPELGIWYDLEDDDYKISNGMPSNEMFVEMAVAFCEKIKSNGYSKVGIYANLYWFNYKLNNPRIDVYEKWVAQWGSSCSYNKPYKMWQYTSQGKVDGITGNVDMNIYYR
ncbi:MAG: hypothetical protein HFJ55_05960 [Clostridia bacterium]|nr:hypothetical protein [Clostridia bacterium]